MTKRNLWLVSLLLVLGLGAMAPSLYAQGTVWSASSNQNTIRDEGDAEAVGTITLTSASTGTIEDFSGFTITYSPNNIAKWGTLYAVGIQCTGPEAATICGAIVVQVPSPKVVKLNFTNTTPFTIAGTNAISIAVRITSQGDPDGTPLTGTVQAFYKFGNQSLTLVTTTGSVLLGLGQVQSPATNITILEGPEYVLTCIGIKKIKGTVLDNDFAIRITENWNDALTSLSDEYNLENNDGSNFAGSTTPTFPTNGSYILIVLSGVPSGVGVAASDPVACNGTDSSASNYCPGGLFTIGDGVAVTSPYGQKSFWYEIYTTNVQAIEFVDFGFKLWSDGPLPPNENYQISVQVWLTDLWPNTVSTAPPNGDMPWFSLPELTPPVSIVEFSDCVTKLLFPYVNTFMGVGYAAFSNFGTGIDIANTTWDPFALTTTGDPGCSPPTRWDYSTNCLYPDEAAGSAVPQSGTCTFYFYSEDETVVNLPYVTPNISAGGSFAFDVAAQVPKFRGHQGYAIAVCNFQNAYGFAELWDNYGIGAPTVGVGYLAYIIPNPTFIHRSPAGDGAGEGAITPVVIDKHIERWLMGVEQHHHH